jgi:MscS family membrane protein
MHDFWNQLILGNPVKKYFLVVGAIVIGFSLKRLLSKYIAGILYRGVRGVKSGGDKSAFIKLVIAPLETFLILLFTFVSVEKLHFPDELNFDIYEISFKSIVHTIATILFIGAFFWLLLRINDFIAMLLEWKANVHKDKKDNQFILFFRDFFRVIIGIVGVLMILGYGFGFEVSKIWTGLGIAGAALALATKESIENLIASFIIFFDKPFTVGDYLKVNNISGTVEKIGLRSTRIRTDTKTYVTVPNKQMVDSVVDNLSLRTQRKVELRLQIGLNTPSATINQFLDGVSQILRKDTIENPSVFLNDIAGNALLINIDYFTPPIPLAEYNEIRQQINKEIWQLMENLKMEIAGANTDIRLNTGAPVPGESS